MYKLSRYAIQTYSKTKNELCISMLSKVIALHTCEQTDMLTHRQTVRCHRNYYHAASRLW